MKTKKLPWKKLRENVVYKPLARDEKRNFQIDMIKLNPKIKYSEHVHPDVEWIYILQGSFKDEKGNYQKGDFLINKKGSKHNVTSGPKGAVILCCWCGVLKKKK